MSNYRLIDVSNSKEDAIKSGKWKNPGAALYDRLLHSFYSKGDVPCGTDELDKKIKSGEWMDWDALLKETYLIAPVSHIKNSPYGVTPFCRSGCKYPHHAIRNGKLVLSIPGVKAAYSRACQQGDFKGDVKDHLLRHIKELGLDTYYTKEGTMTIDDDAAATRQIDENFDAINEFIMEKMGINLLVSDNKTSPKEDQSYPVPLTLSAPKFNRDRSIPTDLIDDYIGSEVLVNPKSQWMSSIMRWNNEDIGGGIISIYQLASKSRKITSESIQKYMGRHPDLTKDDLDALEQIRQDLKKMGYSEVISAVQESIQWIDSFVNDDTFRESIESNMSDILTKCKTPEELLTWMDNIKYGWLDKSGNIQGTGDDDDEEDFFNEYRLQSPSQLIRSKVGVCWDQTELERKWFKAHGYDSNVYYIEIQDGHACPTHTFLVYKSKDLTQSEEHIHWFEHSWGTYKGDHDYGSISLRECLTDITNKHRQANNDMESPMLITRLDSTPEFMCTCAEYMNLARNSPVIDLTETLDGDILEEEYDPPLSYDKLPNHLKNDAVHAWRAKTGMELIHREPTLSELNRIWANWNEMDAQQKAISDRKSMELFGMSNEQHYRKLLPTYSSGSVAVESSDIFDPECPRWSRRIFTEAEDDNAEESIENQPIDGDPPSLDEPKGDSAGKGQDDSISDISEEPEEKSEDKDSERSDDKDGTKPKKESRPKQTDRAERSKNGVRRKRLYNAFIEWCKEFNTKNTFGNIFDKDTFTVSYPFVPNEMRYFYRLANPMLCVLAGDLTFFPVAELSKINKNNKKLDEMVIFAGTPKDLRVFNCKDRKIYRGTEENEEITLHEELGESFDIYIQNLINKGDILNGTIEESTDAVSYEVTEF